MLRELGQSCHLVYLCGRIAGASQKLGKEDKTYLTDTHFLGGMVNPRIMSLSISKRALQVNTGGKTYLHNNGNLQIKNKSKQALNIINQPSVNSSNS